MSESGDYRLSIRYFPENYGPYQETLREHFEVYLYKEDRLVASEIVKRNMIYGFLGTKRSYKLWERDVDRTKERLLNNALRADKKRQLVSDILNNYKGDGNLDEINARHRTKSDKSE